MPTRSRPRSPRSRVPRDGCWRHSASTSSRAPIAGRPARARRAMPIRTPGTRTAQRAEAARRRASWGRGERAHPPRTALAHDPDVLVEIELDRAATHVRHRHVDELLVERLAGLGGHRPEQRFDRRRVERDDERPGDAYLTEV